MNNKVQKILYALTNNGFKAYTIGGCVRDEILGIIPHDYDVVTNATVAEIKVLFDKSFDVGASFGVVKAIIEDEIFDVATFRTESDYTDGRRPNNVQFVTSAVEDVKRRDFTINGLLKDIDGNIVDYVGGQQDISNKIIQTIGNPYDRFGEDYLRMMRAIRFACQFNFKVESKTWEAIKENASKIVNISAERINEEMTKAFAKCKKRGDYIKMLDDVGLMQYIIPNISRMKNIEHRSVHHPEGNVFNHTVKTLNMLETDNKCLQFACLLHDVGKEATIGITAEKNTFFGHHDEGAKIARLICSALKFSNEETDTICWMVEHHMDFCNIRQMRVAKQKRLVFDKNFDLLLELHHADCLGSDGNLEDYAFCLQIRREFGNTEWKEITKRNSEIFNGNDLIDMGFKPSPIFKVILERVDDEILEGKINNKEEAKQFVGQRWDK